MFVKLNKKIIVLTTLVVTVFAMVIFSSALNGEGHNFHSEAELHEFSKLSSSPIGSGDYFLTAAHCKSCHGYDSLMYASVDSTGTDINLHDDWKSTMMANAAKDPYWRAKVSHEILVNPGHTLELQDNCTSCHAPMGNYTSKYKGLAAHYTIGAMLTDSLGMDGVSCLSCHAIADSARLGNLFTGQIPYDTTRIAYGPFTFPMAGPMLVKSGITPKYSDHLNQSKACSPCHTLINKTVDLNGNYTGGVFVEQATFQEWKNSIYSSNGKTCQKCHMPEITSGVVIANDNPGIPFRSPFSQHIFAGANTFMLQLMKQNKSNLGIDVADRFFDSTITATKVLLQQKSVSVSVITDSITADTAYFKVSLLNQAGHKFPSGYPSRRAVLQFVMLDNQNDTLFKSGIFSSDFSVKGENNIESHHQFINQNNRTQIYEMVMGDVNQNRTTVFERAAVLLKDNRLPPQGFTSLHASYDTAKISNDAFYDPNFNKTFSGEGSGKDDVYFHVPISGINGFAKVQARLYYQVTTPKWLAEMFATTTAEIDSFKNYYSAADKSPLLIGADSLNAVPLSLINNGSTISEVKIWPTVSSGKINISCSKLNFIKEIEVFELSGIRIYSYEPTANSENYVFELPNSSGVYLVRIKTSSESITRKIFRK